MESSGSVLETVADGFWNIRGSFKIFSVVELGTHMSVAKLSNGNYLLIDAVAINPEIKAAIDKLTENGTKIEAVVTTHPYHTLAIAGFYDAYPKVPWYGCPRHLNRFPQIPWAGSLSECSVRDKWSPDIEIRVPAGAEFANPLPPKTNHFSCAFVFHKPSRTLHVDDTIIYSHKPGFLLRLAGFRHGNMMFHPSIKGPGLLPNPEAPFQFRDWLNNVINDWDFDNLCTAHSGNKIGGAKDQVRELLNGAEPLFKKLSEDRKKSKYVAPETPEQTVNGDECG